jgi:Tfp pilus assembly protein PilO
LTSFNNIPESEKKVINTVLPDSKNFVKLVSDIDLVASKYAISIDQIASEEIGTSADTSIADAGPEKIYEASLISFNFSSSYENFRKFMNDLERSLRVLDVKSVDIKPQDEQIFNFAVKLQTYWLK